MEEEERRRIREELLDGTGVCVWEKSREEQRREEKKRMNVRIEFMGSLSVLVRLLAVLLKVLY